MREFNVTASTIQWLSTGYMLMIGILVPVTALLQQWFTTRRMFMSAMVLFLAGTCLCALSPGFEVLLIGRVVQACGTGLLIPLMMNTLIDLSVFRYPAFSLVAVLIVVLMMVLFATTTLLPIYMQDVMQLTAFGTGLLLMPGCILNAILMPVTGKLFDKFGPRFVIMPGLLMIALLLWLFAGIDSDTTRGSVLFDHVLLFLGISFVVMPAQTAGMNQLPRHLVPHGTAIYNTLQQIAGGIGIALFVGIMSSRANRYLHHSPDPAAIQDRTHSIVAGLQTVFGIEFILTILVLVPSWFINGRRLERTH